MSGFYLREECNVWEAKEMEEKLRNRLLGWIARDEPHRRAALGRAGAVYAKLQSSKLSDFVTVLNEFSAALDEATAEPRPVQWQFENQHGH